MTLDTIMFTASCTKLLTTISALQCVERGLITLDDDTSDLLPELASQKILTGFDDGGEPILVEKKNPIILRYSLLFCSSCSSSSSAVNPRKSNHRELILLGKIQDIS